MATRESEIDYFNPVAREYDGPFHGRFYRRVGSELTSMLPPVLSPGWILEVGAGTGFSTELLLGRYPDAKIVALEPAEAMLAQGAPKTPMVNWVNLPLAKWSDDSFQQYPPFDLVVSSMSYHWLDGPEQGKLLELAAEGVLALALPVTGCSLKKGNRMILNLIREQGGAQYWPRAVRRRAAVDNLLRSHFRQVVSRGLKLSETYGCWGDLAQSLLVRGALRTLFGDRAERVREMLADHENGSVGFNWFIELFVATNRRGLLPR